MLDCGEGTYGQLVKLLGAADSDRVLRTLAAVYISHKHVDHHIGFIQLLLARRQAFHQAGVYPVNVFFSSDASHYSSDSHTGLHDFCSFFNTCGACISLRDRMRNKDIYLTVEEKIK